LSTFTATTAAINGAIVPAMTAAGPSEVQATDHQVKAALREMFPEQTVAWV